MRKFIPITLLLLFISTPVIPQTSNMELGAFVHNVNRLSEVMQDFGDLDKPKLNNHNSRITWAMKLGELREVIESGQSLGSDKLRSTKLYSVYSKALTAFSRGVNDMENGIRRTDKKSFLKAREHLQNGAKYLTTISKGMKQAQK